MSGRKRALLRMNERDRRKLSRIESRLSQVDQDFSSLQTKINEIKTKVAKNIEVDHTVRDMAIENNISQLDWRIKEIEEATQIAIERQFEEKYSVINQAKEIREEIHNNIKDHSLLVMDLLNQYSEELNFETASIFDELQRNEILIQNQQVISWQTLNYAQEVLNKLQKQIHDYGQWNDAINQLNLTIAVGWENFTNGSYEAALVLAQQAIMKLIEVRFAINEENLQLELKQTEALEIITRILDLAQNSQKVKAIDLEGNELDILIDVDYWSGGLINKTIQTLQSIQNDLLNPVTRLDIGIINELLTQTFPEWEKVIHDHVSLARIEVIASQTRYEVARTVVNALADQGFELESGSFETGDMRSPYHILLGNLEGSKVHVSISASDDNPLNYLMDIDSFDSEFRSEYELRQRARELLGSVRDSGLNVDQVYQSDEGKPSLIKEESIFPYLTKSTARKQTFKH